MPFGRKLATMKARRGPVEYLTDNTEAESPVTTNQAPKSPKAPKAPKSPKAPKAAKIPKAKTPAAHPPYIVMVTEAINTLKERKGSSKVAILKYISQKFNLGDSVIKINAHLRDALKKGVAKKTLVQTAGTGASGSFRVAEKAAVKKTVAKKAATGEKKVKKPAATKKAPTGEKKAKKSATAKPKKAAGEKVKKATSPKKIAKPAAKKVAKSPAKKAAPKKTAAKKAAAPKA